MESCLALWVARAPEREPLAAHARRLERRMRAPVREEARRLDEQLPGWPLTLVERFYRLDEDADVARAIEQLRSGPADAPGGGDRDRAAQRLMGPMLATVHEFWERGFAEMWARQSCAMDAHLRVLQDRLRADPGPTLASVTPRATHVAQRDELCLATGSPSPSSLSCGELEAVEVLPSYWLRRRIVVGSAGRRLGVCVPSAPVAPTDCRQVLVDVMATLGDRRRLDLFLLCLSRPRSTKELARLVGYSPSFVSRQLHELHRHGIVVSHRQGRYVLYSSVPEEVVPLLTHLRQLMATALAGDWQALQPPF